MLFCTSKNQKCSQIIPQWLQIIKFEALYSWSIVEHDQLKISKKLEIDITSTKNN